MTGRILRGIVAGWGLVLAIAVQANTTDEEPPAVATDRKVYAPVGCMACHQVDDALDDRGSESE